MDTSTTQIITTLISATAGILVTLFWQSVKEWWRGRKDEADRLSTRLDTQKAETRRWRQEYDYLRAWILSQSLTEEQLNRMPKPPDDH